MKNLLAGFILIVTLLSCKSDKDHQSNLIELIPTGYSFIIDTPDISNFLKQTDSLNVFETYSSFFTPFLKEQIQLITNLSGQKTAIIGIQKAENNELNYIFLAKEYPEHLLIDSVKNRSAETLTYKDFVIKKYVLEDIVIFQGEKNGALIASNSRIQLEQIMENNYAGISTDNLFIKAHSTIDREKTSLLLNREASKDFFEQSFDNIFSNDIYLAEWNVLEINSSNKLFSINGIATWNDNDSYLLKLFRNTGNQINEIAKITPAEAQGFYSFTYQNIDELHKNLNSYNSPETKIPQDHFLHYTAEAGMIILSNEEKLSVFRTTDPELAMEHLAPLQENTSFRGINVYSSNDYPDILQYLIPLLPKQEFTFYIWLGDFLIFAENSRNLEQVITSYLNNMTLGNQDYYKAGIENLAAASSFLIVANNAAKLKANDLKDAKEEPEQGNNYPVIAMQFVVEKDFAHVHGAFGLSGKYLNDITGQVATITLDAPVATLAFPVKNHINGQTEIIVQDVNNVLYLYSSTGSMIWKKQIPHQITGDIHQIDIQKNGNLQYVYSTPYGLHVIERNATPVKPFPLEFREEITQPLSIFDYDNNRTYRFVLTQGDNILMYDSRGRPVRGFDFEKLSSEIIQPPKHIRLNNKDYIVVPESSGKLNILSRQGKSRIEVREDIDFSASPWYQYKDNFVSVSSKGNLVTVYENGNVSSQPTGEKANTKIAANANTRVIMTDNTLMINDRAVNLDYGLYTSPTLFTAGQNTYIGLTDTQAQRVYVFDENANLLPGFPLYGNSEIRFLDNGEGPHIFSVQGGENEIIIYQF